MTCVHDRHGAKKLRNVVVSGDLPDSELYQKVVNTPHNRALLYDALKDILPEGDRVLHIRTQIELRHVLEWIVLHNLTHHTWARLRKSEYGVGVFAIRDIPAGTKVFETTTGCALSYPVSIRRSDIHNAGLRELLDDFLVPSDGAYPVPFSGMNQIDPSFFLNHSETPNVTETHAQGCDMGVYVTLRDVHEGEELLLNYREFVNAAELRETMPWLV